MTIEGVGLAFERTDKALGDAFRPPNALIAQASNTGRYDAAERYLESAKSLKSLQQQVRVLHARCLADERPNQHPVSALEALPKKGATLVSGHVPGPQAPPIGHPTRSRMILADSQTIEERTAAQTFVSAPRKLGLDRVRALDKSMSGAPLVSERAHDNGYRGH